MRGTFNLANALIVITLSCAPTLAEDSRKEPQEVRRVEGRVLDHEGNSVADAHVWLPLTHIDPKRLAHCRTDASGQFVLEVPEFWVQPSRTKHLSTVWAFKKGHSISTGSAYQALVSKMSNHRVEIQLGTATDTSFVVVDPDGKPVAGATVVPYHFLSQPGYSIVPSELAALIGATTDKDGRARLPSMPRKGFFNVQVLSRQFGTQQQQLNDEADAPAERTIKLRPAGKVVGRLVSDDPKWAREVRFYLTSTVRDDGTRPTSGTAMVVTDDEGRFQVAALAEGDVRVEGGVKQEVPVRVVFPRGMEVRRGEENEISIPLVMGVVAHGRVLTEDRGEPVAGVRVSVRYGKFRQGDDVVSDEDGRFTARILPGSVYMQVMEIPIEKELVEVRAGPPGETRFEVPDTAPKFGLPVIELTTMVRVPGRLLDLDGKPIPDIRLYGVKDRRDYGYCKTDEQGRFTMRVPKGMRMDYYETWVGNQELRLQVKREDPLLLQATLPDRNVP